MHLKKLKDLKVRASQFSFKLVLQRNLLERKAEVDFVEDRFAEEFFLGLVLVHLPELFERIDRALWQLVVFDDALPELVCLAGHLLLAQDFVQGEALHDRESFPLGEVEALALVRGASHQEELILLDDLVCGDALVQPGLFIDFAGVERGHLVVDVRLDLDCAALVELSADATVLANQVLDAI